MCQRCWMGDFGMPVSAADEVLAVAHLIERLYAMPGCAAGGPLHDILDDMNIEGDANGNLRGLDIVATWHGRYDYLQGESFDRWASASPAEKQEIIDLCEAIVANMDAMTDGERAAAIAWHEGWIGAELPEFAARIRTPERIDAIESHAEEMLDTARALPPVEERPDPNAPRPCVPVPCPPWSDSVMTEALAGARLARPDELPDADAIHRFTEDFTARGGVMVLSNEGRIDLGAVVERRGLVDGVIHPGPGLMFAPDAKITGPFERATVNPDGSATLHGLGLHDVEAAVLHGPPLLGNAPDGAPTFVSAHYTVEKDGAVSTSVWSADDLSRYYAPPVVDMAEVLAEPPMKIDFKNRKE